MYHIQIPGFEGSLPNKYMSLYVLIFESIPTINNPLDDTLSLLVCLTSYHSSRLFLSLFQGTSTLAAEVDRKSGISRLHPLILGIHSIKHLFSGTYTTAPTQSLSLLYPTLPFSTLPALPCLALNCRNRSFPFICCTTLPCTTCGYLPYPSSNPLSFLTSYSSSPPPPFPSPSPSPLPISPSPSSQRIVGDGAIRSPPRCAIIKPIPLFTLIYPTIHHRWIPYV